MQKTTIDSFVDVSAWLTHIGTYYTIHIQSGWEFVDALRLGIEQFGGQNRAAVSELYDLASQHVGLAVRTLQNYVSISRTFPADRRQAELGINHYIALQGLPEGQQDEFADMAVAHGLSVEALRHEVRKTRPGYITDTSNEPGRTMSPPSAYHRGYDDVDARAEQLTDDPGAYDESADVDDVPFSHKPTSGDGYAWDTLREQWRHVDEPDASLWPDERICAMVAELAIEATDADGVTWHTLLDEDVCRLLRTMREEYETAISRR